MVDQKKNQPTEDAQFNSGGQSGDNNFRISGKDANGIDKQLDERDEGWWESVLSDEEGHASGQPVHKHSDIHHTVHKI